jgi:hypothetical protein
MPLIVRPSDREDPASRLGHLLWCQDGVVSRQQVIDAGFEVPDLQRMVRRQDLVRVHPGVFVHHNGPLSWAQRAQAAVLHCAPAALTLGSALPTPDESGPIHVAVDVGRTVQSGAGVVVHRLHGFAGLVDEGSSPRRVRLEHAALLCADRATSDLAAVQVLAGVCQSGRTSPARLLGAMAGRRFRRGRWMRSVLADLAAGTESVLEHGYLNRVERPHGLPRGRRQLSDRSTGKQVHRDVVYDDLALIVELDGRLFHDNAKQRDQDFDRDLDAAAVQDSLTVRITYGQVFGTPCRTADRLTTPMRRRGLQGPVMSCPKCTGSNP